MDKNEKRTFIIAGIVALEIVFGSITCLRYFDIKKQNEEKIDGFYKKNAQQLIDDNTYGKTAFVDSDYTNYTTLDGGLEYTNGDYICDYVSNSDIEYVKFGDKYYTSDGRIIYEYIIDNGLYIFEEDDFNYYNGVCRTYDSDTFEDLKDYCVYYDVDKADSKDYDGTTYYRTTRKLIKK
ncbi:MAG: hypothetical protein E7159_03655 [Firmicutes bacterium]|nr:hypothetical protein [Bacillota bacterium]